MDIIWIIFAGLMLYGISKKKPGLMVPFIGLVGFMNVVRTIITKSSNKKRPLGLSLELKPEKLFPLVELRTKTLQSRLRT